jgi:alkyl hydroperoxide reductase subunit AhpF
MSVLGGHERGAIRELLLGLERDVPLRLELGPEALPVTVIAGNREIDFGAEARQLLVEVAELSDRVTLEVTESTAPGRFPTISIGERLRYHGLPWGYELSTLIGGIVEAGRAASSLSPDSLAALATLRSDVQLDVYVTPT